MHSVGLDDLYMFDPFFMKWTRLDQSILGTAPIGRYDLGYTAAGSWLCLFGGASSRNSGICPDLAMCQTQHGTAKTMKEIIKLYHQSIQALGILADRSPFANLKKLRGFRCWSSNLSFWGPFIIPVLTHYF